MDRSIAPANVSQDNVIIADQVSYMGNYPRVFIVVIIAPWLVVKLYGIELYTSSVVYVTPL